MVPSVTVLTGNDCTQITTVSETLVKHAVPRKLSCVKFMIINYHSSVERIRKPVFKLWFNSAVLNIAFKALSQSQVDLTESGLSTY